MADEIAALPGLKEDEIAKLGHCAVCRKPLLDREKASITFYRVTIARAGFLLQSLERRAGLAMMLGGSHGLARAMGPNEDFAKIIDGPRDVAVHEACAGDVGHLLELFGEPADG
jgi:hypothetical protein